MFSEKTDNYSIYLHPKKKVYFTHYFPRKQVENIFAIKGLVATCFLSAAYEYKESNSSPVLCANRHKNYSVFLPGKQYFYNGICFLVSSRKTLPQTIPVSGLLVGKLTNNQSYIVNHSAF